MIPADQKHRHEAAVTPIEPDPDTPGRLAGYFINDARLDEPPRYAHVGEQYRNEPDVVPLFHARGTQAVSPQAVDAQVDLATTLIAWELWQVGKQCGFEMFAKALTRHLVEAGAGPASREDLSRAVRHHPRSGTHQGK